MPQPVGRAGFGRSPVREGVARPPRRRLRSSPRSFCFRSFPLSSHPSGWLSSPGWVRFAVAHLAVSDRRLGAVPVVVHARPPAAPPPRLASWCMPHRCTLRALGAPRLDFAMYRDYSPRFLSREGGRRRRAAADQQAVWTTRRRHGSRPPGVLLDAGRRFQAIRQRSGCPVASRWRLERHPTRGPSPGFFVSRGGHHDEGTRQELINRASGATAQRSRGRRAAFRDWHRKREIGRGLAQSGRARSRELRCRGFESRTTTTACHAVCSSKASGGRFVRASGRRRGWSARRRATGDGALRRADAVTGTPPRSCVTAEDAIPPRTARRSRRRNRRDPAPEPGRAGAPLLGGRSTGCSAAENAAGGAPWH